jgi:hypothetical protein
LRFEEEYGKSGIVGEFGCESEGESGETVLRTSFGVLFGELFEF